MSTELPKEFLLACACCAWPLSETRVERIRSAAATVTQWDQFLRVVVRHRVGALVHSALADSGVCAPSHVTAAMASLAKRVALQNLQQVAESVRLQRLFAGAQIPVVFFKGVTLAQLAYGTLALKHGKDIDLLVPPDKAGAALRMLEEQDYALWQPAEHLSAAQRQIVFRHAKEVALIHRRRAIQVELHWALTDTPQLLNGMDAFSPTRDVPLSFGCCVRTLAEENLFAYLCVHGARHGWSRLKWVADLNALIADRRPADIERLYRHAEAKGAGLCAGQALLLCDALLGLRLSPVLAVELRQSGRLRYLQANSIATMVGGNAETELHDRPFGTTRIYLAQFLLGRGWRYFLAQCREGLVSVGERLRYPLPSSLSFAYPVLRLSTWLWRRARHRGRSALADGPSHPILAHGNHHGDC